MIFPRFVTDAGVPQRHRRTIYFSLFFCALAIVVAVVFFWEQPRPAPDVTMMSLQGENLSLEGWRGKVVLVNFWATNCEICLREMPEMVNLYRALQPRGLEAVFIAMSYDQPARVQAYARRTALPFHVAFDAQGELVRAFGDVPGTPATFIVDKQGRIVRRILGAPDFNSLRRFIESRLAEAA